MKYKLTTTWVIELRESIEMPVEEQLSSHPGKSVTSTNQHLFSACDDHQLHLIKNYLVYYMSLVFMITTTA